jgi:predicted nucleic acid-binding protein
MTDLVFVDTNILVYARDASEPIKQPIAKRWLDRLWQSQAGRLSTQVLSEFYVTVTQKLKPGMPIELARSDMRNLMTWDPLAVGPKLVERALDLQDRFSVSYWDALIIGAAQICDCRILLSEDMQDGQRFDSLRVVNPFLNELDEVLKG